MNWNSFKNCFAFLPANIDKDILNYNNLKISNSVFEFPYSSWLSLDDITNITQDITTSVITSIPIGSNKDNGIITNKYISTLKININLYIEYTSKSGIKIISLNSSIGDFIISDSSSISVDISPNLLCLWKDCRNNLNLSTSYSLYETSISN
ncbi:hypothetical protein [Clostridium sp. LP20]|uniref:hypothetical protein n=1 Tax=Clostridium sp. LP20 TaxID=3418665 RepID=UPI003EE7F9A1